MIRAQYFQTFRDQSNFVVGCVGREFTALLLGHVASHPVERLRVYHCSTGNQPLFYKVLQECVALRNIRYTERNADRYGGGGE